MIWALLSPTTLQRVKRELLDYVQDIARDMSNKDTRIHLTCTLQTLDEIDDALGR